MFSVAPSRDFYRSGGAYSSRASSFSEQCDLKPPPGVNTGAANPYYITAYEQLGGGFVRIFHGPDQPTTNPAVVYFK